MADGALSVTLAGAAPLALLHGAMPSHWLPFAAVARAQRWPLRRALGVTAIGAAAHVAATAALGAAAAVFAGAALGEEFVTRLASLTLIALGGRYLYAHARAKPSDKRACCAGHSHGGAHSHSLLPLDEKAGNESAQVDDWSAMLGVVAVPALSPCATTLPVFFAAAESGPLAVAALTLMMFAGAAAAMCGLVGATLVGMSTVRTRWIERNDRLVVGACLLIIGIAMLLLPHDHGHDHGHHHHDDHDQAR